MSKKWVLFLHPISLTIMATSASGQMSQISNAVAGSDNHQPNKNRFLPDTTFTPVPADSAFTDLHTGWHKASGQTAYLLFCAPAEYNADSDNAIG